MTRTTRFTRRSFTLATLALASVLAVGSVAGAGDELLIRARYEPGMTLPYVWRLETESRWEPAIPGGDWVKAGTDFSFALVAEAVDGAGGCTFRLDGDSLESRAEGPRGAIGVKADPRQASLLLGARWLPPGPNTPFAKRLAVTFGPRFEVRGAEGIEAIALYLLPGVDPRLWFALTTAPEGPVAAGQSWSKTFDVPVQQLGGRPLRLGVSFRVDEVGYQDAGRVVVIRVVAEAALEDFDVKLKPSGRVHIEHGVMTVSGTARWEVDRGVLREAVAEQRIQATASSPRSDFSHRALSRLQLRDGPAR